METKDKNKSNNPVDYPSVIIGKLMHISGILQRESNRMLLPYSLNQQQFSILFEIVRAGEVQQKNMINRLLLEKAHVSKVVKKLQAMGLISISPMPGDKRSALLSPTHRGKNLTSELREIFSSWKQSCFGGLSEEELMEILQGVEKLQKSFTSR